LSYCLETLRLPGWTNEKRTI